MTDPYSDAAQPPALLRPNEGPSGGEHPVIDHQNAASPVADGSEPTDSHALANQSSVDANQCGIAGQESEYGEVLDLGWNQSDMTKVQPIVQGLDNNHLWALLRRFNKQAFGVRRVQRPPLANLDMNIADDEEFSPEKLRAHLERGYVSIVVPLCSASAHLARLRSWNERDLLFTIVLILVPGVRDAAFPPVPISLIDTRTGDLRKPAAGVAVTDDTVTGAPEPVAGAAVEQEAHSFVNTLGSVALSTTIGGPSSDDSDDAGVAPGADDLIDHVSEAKASAVQGDAGKAEDHTREPVSKMVWQRTRPFMHAITDLVDTWERFGNAVSPTPPFPTLGPRMRLVAALLPILLVSFFTTPYMFAKGSGLVFGLVLFGKPLLDRLVQMLERTHPRWQRFVELRHSLLRGVPTNAQLAITLLRIGEKNKAPIPAPPDPDAVAGNQQDTPWKEGRDEPASENVEGQENKEGGGSNVQQVKKRPGKGRRALDLVKGAVKGGVTTALVADRAKALAGAHHAKERVGVVNYSDKVPPAVGPVRFEARYKGRRGFAYLTETSTTPALSWSPDRDGAAVPSWTVLVSDITAVTKVGGFAWPSKVVIGWSLKKQIVDGLVVETKDAGEYHLTAVLIRDEIFNRLIAVGDQMWQLL
ncbi:hypothetical protein IF1G_07354 [Cordyceps javanica]|uniref:Uncharacterized protein n=1 Tax=Cordyceps javanica TaxID=43265 RepID=A0A545UVZ0_9HYPO|nr:hypothetical protein IF1G_07354 [Cordyceps javanica]